MVTTKPNNSIPHLSSAFSFGSLPSLNLLSPLRRQLDRVTIRDAATARWLCRVIPAQCPFERDLYFLGKKVGHIPPLCKLNPFYEELVSLRFRALCYLADQCNEDIRCYC